jgi:3-oxoadipate CoA-transferase alpha subunit
MIDKFVRSVAEALADIKDGSTVLIAGFAQVGEPRALIEGLIEQGAKDLVVVHNTAGREREGVARLIGEGRVRKIVCSFARSRGSVLFEEVYARGEIELEIVPQGTLAERIRAAAAGIPAFFTATAAGTKLADGKETRVFNGREYILEPAIYGDVALVEAWRADRWGNLVYRDAGRNFNPVMAAAAQLTIAQTQHVAELGELGPEEIVTPGLYVDRVVHVAAGDPPLKTLV